jgi:short-subunit dehydrogenase
MKTSPELSGRRIVLTGASEGIGRALALALAARGARLVVAARDAERLASLVLECKARGGVAIAQRCDVALEADCRALIERARAEFGGIDVLVNNAGITMWSRFDALADLQVFEKIMQVNFHGPVRLTRFALEQLRESRGLIVGVASLTGLTGVPERTAYAASKHALVGFLDSLRIELAGTGVDVSVIAPDFVVTETHKRATGADGQPLGASPMVQSKIMTAEACAERIVRAIERRERLVILSLRGRVGRWLKLIAPSLIDRIAARAIRQRH